ncbi:MAG: FAD-binding protein, partial [Chloroflexota bacterium]|nr:FAD-binding protein [Chloroflexota bacterium]
IPVSTAAHYMMGGVKTNTWGETNIQNLFACGETASTGVHGANRLASNSLLEVVVFSKRIVQRVQGEYNAADPALNDHYSLSEPEVPAEIPPVSLTRLQSLMWDDVGIVRSGEELERVVSTLVAWHTSLGEMTDRPSYELANLVLASRIMAEAALIREESRGAHFRFDYPEPLEAWVKHIVFRRKT